MGCGREGQEESMNLLKAVEVAHIKLSAPIKRSSIGFSQEKAIL